METQSRYETLIKIIHEIDEALENPPRVDADEHETDAYYARVGAAYVEGLKAVTQRSDGDMPSSCQVLIDGTWIPLVDDDEVACAEIVRKALLREASVLWQRGDG